MSGPYQPPYQQPQPGGQEGPPTGGVPYGQPTGPAQYGPPQAPYFQGGPGSPQQGGPQQGGPQQGGPQQGGPGGPPPGWSPAGAAAPAKQLPGLDKLLPMVVAGLGVLIVFLSLLDAYSTRASFSFVTGFGWAVALFLVAGLLALGAVLPKAGSSAFPAAVVSLSTTVALLLTLFGLSGVGAGFIIVLILGLLQTIAALLNYLLGAGLIKLAPKPATGGYPGPNGPGGYGPPPGYGPPASQQPPNYGLYGQQQQPPTGQGQPPGGYPNGPQQQ